ncbi:MAG: 16S rRNA (cytidine(1402)-2'-O)-methyltransferase [Nitrospiraceae bacterium]
MSGTLYVVSTPIGNPEDLTFRALRVLRDVQWIACENPLRTQDLLTQYSIHTSLTTYHNDNKEEKIPLLLAMLADGKSVALVCDAGTPVIFDPGSVLISRAVAAGIRVVPIPGASAALAAAAACALRMETFIVQGFFPDRPGSRKQFLEDIRDERRTLILLIQPNRLRPILAALCPVLGNRRLALATNLTMPDEDFLRGTAAELRRHIDRYSIRGELTLVIEGAKERRVHRGKARRIKKSRLVSRGVYES